ncbi:MAG: hypothetical protein EZS28_043292, partial [Streblomastix strix]
TRTIISVLLKVLLIPFVSTAITSFDCFSETTLNEAGENISQSFWRADNSLGLYSAMINLLIHNHNPKNGGLFSCPNGVFNLLQGIFVFGIVFSQRLLYDWQFWRGVVGVLVPGILIIILVIRNPYYSYWSNYLATIPWIIFGVMRLLLEIGYAIEESTRSSIPQILFFILGIISSIALIISIYYVMRILEGRNWLLTSQGLPLVDISEIEQQNQQQNIQSPIDLHEQKSQIFNKTSPIQQQPGLPKIKDPSSVEPRLRFLQDKDIRDPLMIKYADYVYTFALKRHKKDAMLQFQYGIFLQYYRKNRIKAQSVFKLSRSSNPSIPLRFVLYCKTKEGGGQGGQGGSELTSITFIAKMAQAEDYYKTAKQGLLEFFENMSSIHTNFGLVYQQLKVIVESEAKSRKCFEELMVMQPRNTTILRDYARLLLDIYNDEDTAEMIFQRAEMIEDDQSQSGTGQSTIGNEDIGDMNAKSMDISFSNANMQIQDQYPSRLKQNSSLVNKN